AYFRGERLSGSEISGFLIAFAGLIYLILPGAGAPSLLGFILMSISGAAWGVYSLPGKNSTDTLSDTFFNFLRTLPLVAVLLINGVIFGSLQLNAEGLLLAALSGGIASGLGYTIWFLAAKRLNTSQSAAVQLLVPVIAAFFGLSLLDEAITQRLVLSSLLILGGVILVVITRGLVASR
ncbi:DMT family transporter, partial [Oleiphilus sp. HI0066]|uniref:DMT family transporter n=2 Tax=Oleiphilus TaxID=141450 RepID=UPI000A3D8B47